MIKSGVDQINKSTKERELLK